MKRPLGQETRLRALWKIFTLSCEESSGLISNSLDAELPAGQRAALRLHLTLCRSCRRYKQQLHLLNQAIPKLPEKIAHLKDLKLSDPSRQRIKQKLHEKLRRNDTPDPPR